MKRYSLLLGIIGFIGIAITIVHAVPHASSSTVLSELDSASPALPGEQCFSSHEGLSLNGEEQNTLYSYRSFCESVVADLTEAYENEKAFREACYGKYGINKCRHQCRELAQLFDQAVVGRTQSGGKYSLSRGNNQGYTIQQLDCEHCLRMHQCTPKNDVID